MSNPIIFFDLETTGVDTQRDRIVEICVIKRQADGQLETKTRRLNPTIPIPAGASEVHGIYDDDVKNEPTFKQIAKGIHDFIQGCDIAGFNSNAFDVPMLYAEFTRAGIDWDYKQHRFLDVGNMFKRLYPRSLEAAVEMFLGRKHDGAHGAEPDTIATMEVFDFFVNDTSFDAELPKNMNELELYCNYDKPILDVSGKFTTDKDGTIIFNFGKHKGEPASNHIDFLKWMLHKANFANDTNKIITQILNNN